MLKAAALCGQGRKAAVSYAFCSGDIKPGETFFRCEVLLRPNRTVWSVESSTSGSIVRAKGCDNILTGTTFSN